MIRRLTSQGPKGTYEARLKRIRLLDPALVVMSSQTRDGHFRLWPPTMRLLASAGIPLMEKLQVRVFDVSGARGARWQILVEDLQAVERMVRSDMSI